MSADALAEARALLNELTEAARKGAIIPVRLPAQLEAIGELLVKAQDENANSNSAPVPPDMDGFLKEQSAFMSHAIHELRTPMTSIRGYADMLGSSSMGELNPMQQQFLATIRTNARRMEGLLTDVSDISKIRAQTLKMAVKMDMFKNIAMMVEKQVRPLAQELNRTLIVDIPQGLPILNVDGELLAKALVKLAENAMRYSGEGGEVKLTATGDGNKLNITVQDNGIGMSPEDLRQLGTIYFRGDNDVVRGHKGSGLGIPIAYGIIEMLGGKVSVTSEPGKGTIFTVTLMGMS